MEELATQRARIDRLTAAEREVLRFVPLYGSDKAISPHLGISPNAVKKRIARALEKLEISSRHQAARLLEKVELAATPYPEGYAHGEGVELYPSAGLADQSPIEIMATTEAREAQVPYVATEERHRSAWRRRVPTTFQALARANDGHNRQTPGRRLLLMVQVGLYAVGACFAVAVGMLLLSAAVHEMRRQKARLDNLPVAATREKG